MDHSQGHSLVSRLCPRVSVSFFACHWAHKVLLQWRALEMVVCLRCIMTPPLAYMHLGQTHHLCAPLRSRFLLEASLWKTLRHQGEALWLSCWLEVYHFLWERTNRPCAQRVMGVSWLRPYADTFRWVIQRFFPNLGVLACLPRQSRFCLYRCWGVVLSTILLAFSFSTSKHEVMLTANLSNTLTRKNTSCVTGFGYPCSYKTIGSKLPNQMTDNALFRGKCDLFQLRRPNSILSSHLWQAAWYAL